MATKPLSTAARNALLQLYRLGFLWVDIGDNEQDGIVEELIANKCAVVSQTSKMMTIINNESLEEKRHGHQRIEITLRGIDVALQIYKDQQRAIEGLKMPMPSHKGMKPS